MKRALSAIFILALACSHALATDPSVLKFRIGAFSTRSGMPSYKNLGLDRTAAVKSGEAAYYLVQFTGPVTDAWRDQVTKAGGRVFDYIPNYAHVVKMTPEQAEQVKTLSPVTYVGYYQPAFRINPDLLSSQTPLDIEEPGRIQLNVLTFGVADRATVRDRLLGDADVRFLQEDAGGRIFQVSIPASRSVEISKALANYPEVRWVERLYPAELHNTWSRWISQSRDTTLMGSSATTWKAKTRLKSADDSLKMPIYAHGIYGQGQIVGDDDTGLDWDNVYFRDPGGLKPQYDKDKDTVYDIAYNGHRKIVGYNVIADTFDLTTSGHGTHTNGSIAADSMGSTHSGALSDTILARAMGMAPMAKLAFTDIGTTGDGLVLPANYNDIYRWEYNAGARITSSSWGSTTLNTYTANCEQLDTLAWQHQDLLMFRSAANAGPNASTVRTPATAKNIVCVGASESGFGDGATTWSNPGTTSRNEILDVAEFSSHGPSAEGLRRPTFCTPGGWYIWSVDSDGSLTSNNSGIYTMGGTSMACPTAAGLCALVRQYLTEGWYPTGIKTSANAIANPSGALMKSLMILSTRNSPGAYSADAGTGTKSVPSNGQGWGAVVLDKALYFNGDARKTRLVDSAFTATGQSHTYTITTGAVTVDKNNDPMDFKVALVYFDYPSALSPMDISVNNLNLTVNNGATTYLGNVFGAAGYSTTGGTADTLNPEEVVWLPPASAKSSATLTITVTAATLIRTPQRYAITVGGDILASSGFPLAVHFGGMNLMLGSDGVNLTWRTESEQNCLRWEIERSADPEQGFAQVGKVEGQGTTSQPNDYSYTDNTITGKGEYYYRLAEVDLSGGKTYYGPMSITFGGDVPTAYMLAQSIPNPARGGVSISFALRKGGATSLKIYNIAGQVVKTLANENRQAGNYTVTWDGRDDQGNKASNGIYLYRLISGDYQATKKITVLK
jgi:hypothetical protein